jgi:hypothetical protein
MVSKKILRSKVKSVGIGKKWSKLEHVSLIIK